MLKLSKIGPNIKWFSLFLWAFGTRSFALLGRLWLERECAINQHFHKMGFHVPKLLAVNPNERSVFMEYIEGKSIEKIVKKAANIKNGNVPEEFLEVLKRVGETFAQVHELNITLGDTNQKIF